MMLALLSGSAWAQSVYHSYSATSGTSGQSGQGYAKLVDNNTSTKWCVVQNNNTWSSTAYIEFESADLIIPSQYVMTTGNDNATYSGRNPKSWVIKAKVNSGDSWSTLASVSNNTTMQDINYKAYTFDFPSTITTAYKYFRFEISAIQSGGVMQLSEFHFIATIPGSGTATGEVTIGTGTETTGYAPVFGNYKSSYVQMIYTASQLHTQGVDERGTITKIWFNSGNSNMYSRKPVIYMGNVSKTSFSDETDFVSISSLTQVYDYNNGHGQWNITTGWQEFELDTPFEYDGSSDLVIAMYCSLISDYNSSAFYYTRTSNSQVIHAHSDSNDPNPTTYEGNWSTYSGRSRTQLLPNLKLYYTPGGSSSGDCEDFESYDNQANTAITGGNTYGLPEGWSSSGNTGDYKPHLYKGDYSIDGVGIVMTSGLSDWGGSNSYLISNITLHTGDEVSFNTYRENSAYGTMYYGYIDNSNNFQQLSEANSVVYNASGVDPTQGMTTFTVPSAANGKVLAWHWYLDSSYFSAVIDNVCVSASSITEIASKDDWEAFCAAVNGGHNYSGETVTLTADLSSLTTICGTYASDSDYKAFKGTFDGGGHTLSFSLTDQPKFSAPFKIVESATIQNLRTAGSITGRNNTSSASTLEQGKVISGLVAISKGTTNITGCSCTMSITSYYNSGNDVALSGLVASIMGGTLTVEGCAFEGSMTASTNENNHNGGIVGYWYSGDHIYVRNTIFAPTALNVTTGDTGYSYTIARTTNSAQVTVENCYYTMVLGNAQGKEFHTVTAQSPATAAMSGTETNYGVSGIKAYKDGSTQLTGLLYNDVIIAGNGDLVKLNLDCTLSSGQELDGYTASNGGSISGSGNPYTLTMPNNNTVISADISTPKYHIANSESSTAMTWAQFAASVSGGKTYSGQTIYLDEDITTAVTNMAGTSTDVQVGANAFKGTFDGQGYTLTIGLTKGTSTHTAPFVYINGATIKDLNVEGEINIGNNQFAGGLVGISEGFNTITNCKVNVTINSTKSGDGTHGGFVSLVQGGTTTFTGCAFTGKLLGANTDSWGGFVGYSRGTSTLSNCVFVPQQLSFSSNGSSTFVRNGSNFTNCYYTEAMNTLQGSQVYSVTPVSPATVAMSGTASPSYDVSGLGFYTNSFTLTNASTTTIYAKGDATLSLTLGGSAFSNYDANHGTLTGSGSSWSLAMEAYNTEISAYACYPLSNLQANGATITWNGNDASYIVELEEEVTTTEIQEILNESFEGISGTYNSNGWMPVGWYSYTTATGNNIVAPHVVNSGNYCYPHTGSGAINMESGTNATATTGNNAYVVLPLCNNATELSFYARCESTSHKTLKVGRVTAQSVSGCNGFIELKTIFLSETVTQYTMDLAHDYIIPSGEYIAFLWNTTGTYYACGIDDVVVKGNVEVPTTTWTPVTDNATSPYTFRGLEPGSTHLARVVSECGQVSNEVEFTMPDIATITKAIEGYGNGEGKWYFLTSPLDATVAPTAVTNMIAPTAANYDLYYFKQNPSDNLEWINYKESSANGGQFSLEAGKGYLYANKNNVTLSFTGVPYQGNGEVAISYIDGYRFSGWNLVGNPFNQTASVNRSFYEMNPEGTEIIANTSGTVDPMEGIFVIASENSTVTFTPASGNKSSKLVIDITQGLGALDRAVVDFKDNGILPKFQLNANHTKVYLPKNGKDYAVLTAESDMGEMPVGFKAERNGSYTLSVNAEEVSFAYLHLIDNMNGNDIDLLQTPYYTFDAMSSDYTDRFTLIFATGNDDDAFAYYNNGNWIINNNGTATLQVVDVTGHILSSETISGNCSKAIDAASGVYMLRLINGNDVKVQKIIVNK